MNKKWSEMTVFYKMLLVLRLIVSLLAVLFAVLQLTNVWENANHVAIPLVGVIFLLQAIWEWNVSRRRSIFSLSAFFLIVAFSFAVWFVK